MMQGAGFCPLSIAFRLALPLSGDIQDRHPGPYSIAAEFGSFLL